MKFQILLILSVASLSSVKCLFGKEDTEPKFKLEEISWPNFITEKIHDLTEKFQKTNGIDSEILKSAPEFMETLSSLFVNLQNGNSEASLQSKSKLMENLSGLFAKLQNNDNEASLQPNLMQTLSALFVKPQNDDVNLTATEPQGATALFTGFYQLLENLLGPIGNLISGIIDMALGIVAMVIQALANITGIQLTTLA